MRRDAYKSKHRSRARKAGVAGSFDSGDVLIRLAKQKEHCHYCGCKLELFGPDKFQVDHFIPLSKGGENSMNNIVIACPGCNREKASRMPWEYRPARFEVGCTRD